MHPDIHIKARVVVQLKGENLLGPGRIELMEKIQSTGSISEAARDMGMSYRKALQLINHINDLCGQEVILTWKGGTEHGGARLSPLGEDFVLRYKVLNAKVSAMLAAEGVAFLP